MLTPSKATSMKRILICPSDRAAVAFLGQSTPLVTLPILGEPLIGYWLEHLVSTGVKETLILATDRPDQVRAAVGDGVRWGIKATVQAEMQELSPEEAEAKYSLQGWSCRAVTVDHLPRLPELPLFAGYAQWFSTIKTWLPCAALNRVGYRQVQPGIWVGLRTQISRSAELHAPCWLGQNVLVGRNCVIGPYAVLEDRVVVESASEISDSIIAPDTYVGALTRVQHSLACGSTLIDWQSGSCAHVPDAFLLCSLAQRPSWNSRHWLDRWLDRCSQPLVRSWEFMTRRRPGLQ
jgi:hypothetical protein